MGRKLLVFYLPLFVLPSVIGLGLLAQSYNAVTKENATSYSRTIVNLTADKMNSTIDTLNNLSLQILSSNEVGSTLENSATNDFERLEIQKALEQKVLPIIGGINEKIIGIVFNMPYGTFTIGQDPGKEQNINDINEIQRRKGAPYWGQVYSANDQENEIRTFRLSRVWKDNTFKPIGTYYLVINADVFRNILSSAMSGANTQLDLAGKDGTLLSERNTPDDLNAQNLRISKDSNSNEWYLDAYFAPHSLYSTVYRMSSFAIWLAIGCIILGVIASQIIRSDVAVPIFKLMVNMRLGLKGKPPSLLHKFKGAREITELNDTFISVMYEIYNLIDEVKKSEERKRLTQLKVLQNQLSPHFLYNTLNSIRWMAMIRKQDHIRDMVDALSNLLRYSIRDTDELVTLEEEISIMRNFVKIQQVRYQNFSFVVELEDGVRKCRIMKLLVQPIIENAIIHGLSSINHAGEIRIDAFIAEGRLCISIKDNGIGIPQEKLSQIREGLKKGDETSHIGLSNVKERIELHYGATYGMDLMSRVDEGTTVNIILPLLESGGEDIDA